MTNAQSLSPAAAAKMILAGQDPYRVPAPTLEQRRSAAIKAL